MKIVKDADKGKKVAELLFNAFLTTGILGRTEMPEDLTPRGIQRGSLEHLLFLTLTVSIDYQRDAVALWQSSRQSFEGTETRYLFDPKSLHEASPRQITMDMQIKKLSKKSKKDAHIWRTVGVTFFNKWDGDPRNFLESCNWDSLTILDRLKNDNHVYNQRSVSDYPYLRGPKIGSLWVRMLRDNAGIEQLKNLDAVPIPVDIHVARATLATGVIRGKTQGQLHDLFEDIRTAWAESLKGLYAKDRPMIALDVDEPLWHLSKYGCTYRDKENGVCPLSGQCEAREFCVKGKIAIEKSFLDLDT
jgi:hypothetical protein